MKNLKKWAVFTLVLSGIIAFGKPAFANQFNFSVKAVLPENQASKASYFDLLMKPDQEQTLSVELSNSTDKSVTVEQGLASATTNLNGVVEYSPNNIKADSSLKYNMKNYVNLDKEIVLPAKTTKTVKIKVKMPATRFKGYMAGGLTYKEKQSEKKTSDSKGISIQNEYAYVIALLMSQESEKVAPDLKLTKVAPGQVNYRNVINANLQNPTMGYLNQMQLSETIKGIDNPKLVYKSSKEMMQMAPNSNFDYPLSLNGEKLQPGKYQLKMTVHGQKDENGKYVVKDSKGNETRYKYEWKFTQDFEITADKARELNQKDVTIKQDNSWIKWLIIALIILVLILILFFILWKRRKKEEDEKTARIAELEKKLDEKESKK
ncbi:DUF916 and DUF3324 domain-containing protein [Lactococcus garvieae]|uniref:Cell surface protein n=1 Tax=Lactococcus garvieae DCC43 TaxID=1231377 RepID=K2PJG1_9LACT|nr:DUF916 and DUF3324 domain-containing protein [Lactococcus garvieae]EKF51515.1 cell surface protein precursor [Lactococcus garvieae DCC43]